MTRLPGRVERRARLAQLDDLALLGAVLDRRRHAFEVFLERHRKLILACARRVAEQRGVRPNEADLADLFGDVTEALLTKDLHRLRMYRPDGGCSVSSWVGVIAGSVTRDALRRARRRPLDFAPVDVLERALPASPPPSAAFEDRERRAFVNEALTSFSDRDRRFLSLYFLEALPPEAIAWEMGVSVATVYSKKAKIKRRLAALARAA